MRRICFFSVFPRSDSSPAFKQARFMVRFGYEATVVFADGLIDEIKDGVRVTSISASYSDGEYRSRLTKFPRLFWQKLKEIDADVYETSDIDLLYVCLRLIRKKKVVIFRLLEDHPFTLYDKLNYPRWLKSVLIKSISLWMRYALKRLSKVYTVAPDIVDYLTKWGVKNVEILGNYPEINNSYSLSLEEYLQRENRIIYFGAIYSISRQEVFFDALLKCPSVSYLLAGDFGVGSYKNRLRRHTYWKDVEFINKFPKTELPHLISRCTISNVLRDFSVTGYPQGSYGIVKLYESMEAGIPIICSDVPVYQELMHDYKCGLLVNPNDSNDIARAIKYLTTHKEVAYEMGQNGRRAVLERYNWAAESHRYLNDVERLLCESH